MTNTLIRVTGATPLFVFCLLTSATSLTTA